MLWTITWYAFLVIIVASTATIIWTLIKNKGG